ncbi:hypothetical protein DYBT9275_02349 [Dyadobacter sp. CECT 9275]|uniref:DUF4249 domain-containing protein n=1 Tax=Dyadobacter helix TaxID=2822344 RepID=A0A916JBN6_9BACT|nr:DUF4249 domain-containing protein [Dyadobacter sp. CECT 9275]CAG4999941.1 hypothetical protein DYBT9275_02349 [Dyadobacter sp. CECT 9275]
MSTLKNTAAILLLTSSLFSCEKVIDVELNPADQKYVIEGQITNLKKGAVVVISQTTDFENTGTYPGISGAIVTISDAKGNAYPLIETQEGFYQDTLLLGKPGMTYHLHVKLNGSEYMATSTMPDLVKMDSVFVEKDGSNFSNRERYLANVSYTDPGNTVNFYRFVQFKNGVKEKTIFIRNDERTNGNAVTAPLRYPADDDNDLLTGDNIRVEMQCIDQPAYQYWYSLDRGALGDGSAASPANPVSNIQGGALGYFSAHTSEIREVKVP